MIWLLFSVVFVGTAKADHFLPLPDATPIFCDYLGKSFKINGADAQLEDEIAFFDPNGVLCGVYVVERVGEYGIVHVYGDDTSTTEVDEGASDREVLTVKIWDASEVVELNGTCVMLSGGENEGSFVTSSVPPIWHKGRSFVLNIDTALPPPADLNADCEVDILDVMLALQVICGVEVLQFVTDGADLDSDHRIGLQEVIYILQEVAVIREK